MKKIILSLILIISIFIGYNNVAAVPVSNTGAQTYTAAKDQVAANAKQKCYGTVQKAIDDVKDEWEENGGYFNLRSEWNRKQINTAPYRKYIWREIIGGNVAYCLDPGLHVADDYTVKEKKLKKWSELTNKEKIYATIYNADFSGLKLYASIDKSNFYELPRDENTDYIIKQLLFWAYEANNDIFTIEQGDYYGTGWNWSIVFNEKEFAKQHLYPNAPENYHHTSSSILTEDIFAAVFHYAYNKNYDRSDGYKNIFSSYWTEQDTTNGYTVVFKSEYKNYNLSENYYIITPLRNILQLSYKELDSTKYEEIAITKFVPTNGNTTDYQEFIGIHVKNDEVVPKYAVLKKIDSGYSKFGDYPDTYTQLKADKIVNAASTITIDGVDYRFKKCEVYKSVSGYDSPKDLINKIKSPTFDNQPSTYTLTLANAAEYNVIVLNYEKINYGTLTVQKKIRYNDGRISDPIGDPLTYILNQNRSITIDQSLSSGGTTYYYFKHVNGSSTTYQDSDLKVDFPKSESNVTLTIYYGLRRIDYAHKIGDSTTLESGTIYKYNSWGAISNLVSAKSTPWYTTLGSTYIKLNYDKGKYGSGSTTVAESSVNYSNKGTQFIAASFGLDAMGAKDNDSTRVHFYYNVVDSTKIVVRHFVKQNNGTYALNNGLANSQTVVYNGEQAYSGVAKASYTIVNNKYSQRKSVVKGGKSTLTDTEISAIYSKEYSEIYEIDKNDKIIIDRSRILLSDGTYYKCQGFKTKSTTSSTNDLAVGVSGVNTTSSLRQTIGGTSGYVYIDYYYEPVAYSTDVNGIGNSARLKYMTKAAGTYASLGTNNSVVNSTASGAKESDNVAYVPVTENLKPYIITDKFRVRNAKYQVALSGNNMIYNISSYQTWAVSDDSNMASVGSIVGNGNNLVYDANKGSLNVSDVNTLRSERAATYNVVKNITGAFTGNATSAHTTFNSILTNVASAKTNEAFYSDSTNYNISSTKYNGLRNTTGSINYKIYNVTSSSNSSAATGNNTMAISEANSMSVNIYTPATVGEAKIKSIDFVNHSNSNSVSIIQQGVTFSVTVSAKKDTAYPASVYNKITNTGKYIKYWYLMFDFDVKYGGKIYKAYKDEIPGEAIMVPVTDPSNPYAETTISGIQAVTTATDKEIVESTLNNIKVIAGTANLPSQDYAKMQIDRTDAKKPDANTKHIDNEYVKQRTSANQNDGLGMLYDSYYLVSNPQENLSVGRIFDFEITDCLDVNFKDVFRILTSEEEVKNSSYSPINVLTGTRYFSGTRRLMVTDSVTSATTNNLVNRGNIDAGAVKKILPLGPYKHTTNTYIKAVKLGYRFSFDLKTSGYYSPKENTSIERYVKVTPSYYYISKDGRTYNNNIKLYYKNSSGKYVDFETSNYTIYYKPDDGYRNLYNSSTYQETDVSKTTKDGVTTLTSSLVGLKIGSKEGFVLSDTKSMTISDAGYLQAWYGEFKLPNSAVALAVDASGNVDINNPLTNGYIGVKFNMECVDTYTNNRTVTISYNSNDKGLGNNQVNTSQWDYEGYLGFKTENIGKELQNNIKIQLENGVWSVDANTYKAIKGTVIFYDLDDRAANDYD